MIENLKEIHDYDLEWLRARHKVKNKLKPYFWFYENLHAFGFVGLFGFYIVAQLPMTGLLLFKASYFFQWIYQFLVSSAMNSIVVRLVP